jgi:hypothetical protein
LSVLYTPVDFSFKIANKIASSILTTNIVI